MKLPGLLTRTNRELPGVVGVARVDRRTGDLLRRVGPGDIVVLNQLDLDRRTADALIAAEVAGVVNASASISGRFPNLGPEILVSAGVPLIDNVGVAALHDIKEGAKLRLQGGTVYLGERELATGAEQTPESVGDPDGIRTDTLQSGAEVVVPADADGHAPGLERIQDLGIGAVTFPASGNAEDLALILADTHGASLVVTVGSQATLAEFLDRGRSGSNPSTFLTRLKLGSRLVDGKAVATLHRARVSTTAVVLLILAVLLAIGVALAVSAANQTYLQWLTAAYPH